MLDNETGDALDAATTNGDALAETAKKPRNINHAARCRKAWDVFLAAAQAAKESGVTVELTDGSPDVDEGYRPATDFTASITATY